jgi:hypothetical protein
MAGPACPKCPCDFVYALGAVRVRTAVTTARWGWAGGPPSLESVVCVLQAVPSKETGAIGGEPPTR